MARPPDTTADDHRALTPEAARRRRLLDAAAATFLRCGYVAATMEAIALACGMSKKTLYQVFPSKQALFDALLQDRLVELPVPDDLGGDNQEEQLTRLLVATATMLLASERIALVRVVIAASQNSPDLVGAFTRIDVNRNMVGVERWLAREQAAGRLDPGDVASAALLVFSMTVAEPLLSALIDKPIFDPGALPLERRIRLGARLFLHGTHAGWFSPPTRQNADASNRGRRGQSG